MKTLQVDNRGNVNIVLGLLTTAIVLYVASIVIGKLSMLNAQLVGCPNPSSSTSANFEAYLQLSNLTKLSQNALSIASIGLLIMAAIGILSYFGVGFGGRKGGRK